jgi:hypothetical protein
LVSNLSISFLTNKDYLIALKFGKKNAIAGKKKYKNHIEKNKKIT